VQTTLLGIDVPQLFLASAAVALWFHRPASRQSRVYVLVAFAAFFATYVLARVLQHVGHRPRPLVNVPLHPLGDPAAFHQTQAAMSHWGSFPSDHAALWAIATIVAFAVGRRAGFVFLAIGLYLSALRVGFGYHWPSDIAGGAALGCAIILVLLAIANASRSLIDRILAFGQARPSIAAVVSFVVLSEFADAFHFTQMIASSLHTRLFH
jgi:undecaprenyl-diphosphatase